MKTKLLCTLFFCVGFYASLFSQTFQWAKQLGGTFNDDGRSVAIDGSGNVYTTGWFNGTVDFDPGIGTFNLITAGSNDIFISKLDASGNFLWAKRMGGTGDDESYSITLDAAGNVYTTGDFSGAVDFDPGTGTFNLTSAGIQDIFISKLDPSGNFIWAKRMGGTYWDYGYSITTDTSANIYTTGRFEATVDFDPNTGTFNLTSTGGVGDWDIFVSKLDSSGNFLWAKKMGTGGNDFGQCINIDGFGNVFTTGRFAGTGDFDPGTGTFFLAAVGFDDIFISKLNSAGNFIWAKRIGGTTYDGGYSIATDTSGNVYTTGYFAATVDFDPGTGTFNLISAGNYDIFISKLDSAGNFLWAKRIGSTGDDQGLRTVIDASGNIFTTGFFTATVDFNPGVGTFNLTSAGIQDIFISKLDPSGNFVSANSMGGTGIDFGRYIILDALGNIYTTGRFDATADFDPSTGTFNLTSVGGSDIFVVKLSSSITGINDFFDKNSITIYPNPTSGIFTIEAKGDLTIYNLLGEVVFQSVTRNPQLIIDLSNQPKGIYFIKINSDNQNITKKLIIN